MKLLAEYNKEVILQFGIESHLNRESQRPFPVPPDRP